MVTAPLFLGCGLFGCATLSFSDSGPIEEKLARMGLRRLSEQQALIPKERSGRWLPVEVMPGSSSPLEEHPAGYLIVGIERGRPGDVAEILSAIEDWGPGRSLELVVRRNPYRGARNESWDVELTVPW